MTGIGPVAARRGSLTRPLCPEAVFANGLSDSIEGLPCIVGDRIGGDPTVRNASAECSEAVGETRAGRPEIARIITVWFATSLAKAAL